MNVRIQILLTEDGSHTLVHPELDETYHSVHGAIQESKHVFIQAGFTKAIGLHQTISLLEVGFGTGLNALLTLNEVNDMNIAAHYTGLEPYPVSEKLVAELNYPQRIGNAQVLKNGFMLMHQIGTGVQHQLSPTFTFEKRSDRFQDFKAEPNSFNLIYYDAFSPEKVPEMWDVSIFKKLYLMMQPGGILVTYCAKGTVRRAMQHSGFMVERLAGPPGKREILRAVK